MPPDEVTETTATPAAPTAAQVAEPAKPTALATIQPAEPELITPGDPRYAVALEPRTHGQAFVVAKRLHESRLFPALTSPEAILAVIMAGRSRGIDAMTMLQSAHVIEGKVCLHASMIVGLVLKSGKADYFKLVESTNEIATYKTHRSDDPDSEPTTFSYTIADAKQAMLLRDVDPKKGPSNWHKIPRTMLRWRCATELARAVYPDVTSNLYTPDELDETRPVLDVAS